MLRLVKPWKFRYQNVEQAELQRQVAGQRRLGEMPVHRVRAFEQRTKWRGTDGHRDRQPDRAPQRVAPAHPIPEAEGGVDAELRRGLDVGGGGGEVLGDVAFLHALRQEPLARSHRVGHRLLRREGFGGDDEERLLRTQAPQHARQVVAVDIADEVHRELRMHEGFERHHRHLRPEIAAADADVDDVADAAGRGVAHALDIRQHRVEHAVHLVGERSAAARRAQRGMQHGAAFGGVDGRAGEHRVALRLDAALARQVVQEVQRGGVDQVLRQVGVDLWRAPGEGARALGVAREGLAQIEFAAMRAVVAGERGPGFSVVAAGHHGCLSIIWSSCAASAAKARMPSASLSLAIASALSAKRKAASL